MIDRKYWEYLLRERFFPELAYFAGVSATASSSPEAHLFAGIGCCGHVVLQANVQRIIEDAPLDDEDLRPGGLGVSPMTRMPFAGLDHLIAAFRADPGIAMPQDLHDVIDGVADDLAYTSRREIQTSQRHSHGQTCIAAALLLRRLTGSEHELPGVMVARARIAEEILAEELGA